MEEHHQDLVESMQKKIIKWLNNDNEHLNLLVDWLQGVGFPPFGHDEEPYKKLLYGIPVGPDRNKVECKFSARVRKLLESKPDIYSIGERPEQLMYNLLMLCSGLSCPDYLADPLYEMLERGKLQGEYLGFDLSVALWSALIDNQIDNRLQNKWQEMLNNYYSGNSPIDVYSIFEGILLMPESEESRGVANKKMISQALGIISKIFDQLEDNVIEFEIIINEIYSKYPGQEDEINEALILHADKFKWPQWAINCLPLYVPVEENNRGELKCYISKPIDDDYCMFFSCKVVNVLCNRTVYQVKIPLKRRKEFHDVTSYLNATVLGTAYKSPRAKIGAVITGLSEYEIKVKDNDPGMAEFLKQKRKSIFNEVARSV